MYSNYFIFTILTCFFFQSSVQGQTDIPTYCPDDFRLIVSELGQEKTLSLTDMTVFKRLLKGLSANIKQQKNEITGEFNEVVFVEESEFIYHHDALTSFNIKDDVVQLEVMDGKIVKTGMSKGALERLFPVEYANRKENTQFIQLQLCHPIYPESIFDNEVLIISWDTLDHAVNSIRISGA